MKQILGLDLGVNSIGWALIDEDSSRIVKAGSRILPMDDGAMSNYDNGTLQSAASVRTSFRSMRRLYQRAQLRRERLLRVLNILGFLPEHYKNQIDFDKHPGQFINHCEPLLPYRKDANGRNQFIFMDSFQEMLHDFELHHPHLVEGGKKVPYDWTIYYLRKKALTKPVSRQELAWILLNFNTKRGYYQLRGDETLDTDANEEYALLKVVNVEDKGPDTRNKSLHVYEITFDNGAKNIKKRPSQPHQIGEQVEAIVKTTIKKDGTATITVREPRADDWTLMKKRTERLINDSQETVGAYIYDNILENPDVKVRGKLVHTVERKFYKKELRQILETQKHFIPELNDRQLLAKCVNDLYRNNEGHQNLLMQQDFVHLLLDDIIFYQRPLKSKKSLIANCPLEVRYYKDKDGNVRIQPLKCIAKSNPYFQEFRLWQFVHNLRIYAREQEIAGKVRTDVDVTAHFIQSEEDLVRLFDWLNEKKEIKQDQLLKSPLFALGSHASRYRWNYVEDKAYPCNETHYEISHCMKTVVGNVVLTREQEYALWHILYSVDDIVEIRKALKTFAFKNGIEEDSFVSAFQNMKPFEDSYGSYSEKAIKKLLPLMRCGKYWDSAAIDDNTKGRIEKIVNGEVDETISMRTRDKAISIRSIEDCRNLPLWLASYIVYDKHSETSDTERWQTPEDIDRFLATEFKQNSLRNPTVEAVLGETLRVVRDIWKTYGDIAEVHVEMARDLKQPKDKRVKDNQRRQANENVNYRIRALLQEFASPEYKIDNVRPNSPSQQELFKIYEDFALNNITDSDPDNILVIADALSNPSKSVSKQDIMKYRLWLEQKYLSPYTGQTIPFSKLFTPAYEIEHVIPKSRYYDDSFKNKVICESEVNKDKGNMLAYEYIQKRGSAIIPGANGKQFRILDKNQYVDFVNNHYKGNPKKLKQLLMDDIPENFIQRQMNDTRYIARKAIELLSHLVREKDERESTSKNVIATNGNITDRLKKDWGLNDVWNDIVAPRFERMNRLTESEDYGHWVNQEGKRYFQCSVPLELAKGFSKKRIDHRHHAMDAIVIAMTSRDIVNYMNNMKSVAGKAETREGLRDKLCEKHFTDSLGNYSWLFKKPWLTFTQDARTALLGIIVSFKQNLRVINKMTNHYWHYENGVKVRALQTKGDGWALRKSLHKATVSGPVRMQVKVKEKLAVALTHVNLIVDKDVRKAIRNVQQQYKGHADSKTILKYFKDRKYIVGNKDIRTLEVWYTPKVAEYCAHRVPIDTSFNHKMIKQVTDSGIRKILMQHLDNYTDSAGKEHPELAFSPEGIVTMNDNIASLNGGHPHKPIYKVRKYEPLGMKFPVGEVGDKSSKLVEADKGTNLFFSIYVDDEGKRYYISVPFNEAVVRMKNGLPISEPIDSEERKLLFTLSPFDLVYMPDEGEETEHFSFDHQTLDTRKIYKFVSFTKKEAFFVPHSVAKPIKAGLEFNKLNKIELDDNHRSIKQYCVKLHVDRLGNIK